MQISKTLLPSALQTAISHFPERAVMIDARQSGIEDPEIENTKIKFIHWKRAVDQASLNYDREWDPMRLSESETRDSLTL